MAAVDEMRCHHNTLFTKTNQKDLRGNRLCILVGGFVFPISSPKCNDDPEKCYVRKEFHLLAKGQHIAINHRDGECGCSGPSVVQLSDWTLPVFFKEDEVQPNRFLSHRLCQNCTIFVATLVRESER